MIKSGIKSPQTLITLSIVKQQRYDHIGPKLKSSDLKNKKNDNFTTAQNSNFVNFYRKITGEQRI